MLLHVITCYYKIIHVIACSYFVHEIHMIRLSSFSSDSFSFCIILSFNEILNQQRNINYNDFDDLHFI